MADLVPYSYSALAGGKCIRIFRLSKITEDCLDAQMEIVQLKAVPPYEAISYVWGASEKPQKLIIDQCSFISITQSLYNALKSIRDYSAKTTPRTLWADAICINQEDNKEKSEQVQLMAQIYRSAKRVLTYTGEAIPDLASGTDLARMLVDYGNQHRGLLPAQLITPPMYLLKTFPDRV